MEHRDRFGPFILERLLGRGGMGAVYRARHEETGQTVAVKTLLTPLEPERERFEAEISTLKLLRHENIVKLHGFGQEDGVLYYAMEYVDAPSLATLLKRGRRFTWEEVVYIGASVCRALKHAHDRGVVHRDVKPANILLLDDGVVKVTDYGIAQYFGSSRLTGANQVVGTIEYMAPEQAQAGPLTPRTDVYALGAMLYALLTGSPPYRARSLPELLRRYREETPESIRCVRPEAPNVLDAFLRELLQISPEKRPGDARLIGRRLEGILKTASDLENDNPFLNQRFFLDGSSIRISEDDDSVVAPPPESVEPPDETPDLPYRSFDDERCENDAKSPFERTTEIDDSSSAAPERFDETVSTDAEDGDGGFDLEETAAKNVGAPDDDFGLATAVAKNVETSDDGGFDLATAVAKNVETSDDGGFDLATAVAKSAETSDDGGFDLATAVAKNVETSDDGDFGLATAVAKNAGTSDDGGFDLATAVAKNAGTSDDGGFDLATAVAKNAETSDDGGFDLATAVAKSVETSDDGGFDLATAVAKNAETSDDGGFDLATAVAKSAAPPDCDETIDAAIAFENDVTVDFQASTEVEIVGEEELKDAATQKNDEERESSFEDDDFDDVEATPLEKFKRSRFTPVAEGELDALPQRAEKPMWVKIGQISALCGLLFGIAAFLCFIFQKPSADALYERIEAELRVPDVGFAVALGRAENDLRKLVELYPDDPRSETARGYLERLDAEAAERRLKRRLERRRREGAVGPIERAYFDALRAAEDDPDDGVVKLKAFVALLEMEPLQTNDGELREREFVDAFLGVARRRLERLVEEREKARADDAKFLAERWEAAVALAETDPETAEKTRRALLELYGERDWANEALREARTTAWSAAATSDENAE